jgi:SH3-like domain-containing protein
MVDYLAIMKKELDDHRKIIASLEKKVNEALSKTQKTVPDEDKRLQIEQQRLDLEREKLQWQQLVDAAKGIGWVLDRLDEDEE